MNRTIEEKERKISTMSNKNDLSLFIFCRSQLSIICAYYNFCCNILNYSITFLYYCCFNTGKLILSTIAFFFSQPSSPLPSSAISTLTPSRTNHLPFTGTREAQQAAYSAHCLDPFALCPAVRRCPSLPHAPFLGHLCSFPFVLLS